MFGGVVIAFKTIGEVKKKELETFFFLPPPPKVMEGYGSFWKENG